MNASRASEEHDGIQEYPAWLSGCMGTPATSTRRTICDGVWQAVLRQEQLVDHGFPHPGVDRTATLLADFSPPLDMPVPCPGSRLESPGHGSGVNENLETVSRPTRSTPQTQTACAEPSVRC